MGIQVVLYGSSPVVQKIFFHILYHHRPTVQRVSAPSELMEKIQYSRPDIIFMESAVAKDQNIQAKIKEGTKNIPVILMSKTELDQTTLQSVDAKDFLKKPISADRLRELVHRFVPKTKSNLLTKHLQFAPVPDFQEDYPQEAEEELSQAPTKEMSADFSPQPAQKPTKAGAPPTTPSLYQQGAEAVASSPSSASSSPSAGSETAQRDPVKEGGINPITATNITSMADMEKKKSEENALSSGFGAVSSQEQKKDSSPAKEGGINPITATNITSMQPPPAPEKEAGVPPATAIEKEAGVPPATAPDSDREVYDSSAGGIQPVTADKDISANLPPSEEPADLPPSEEPADLPPSEESANLPSSEEPADLPPSEEPADSASLEEPADLPPSEEPADLPPSEEPADLPPSEEPADLPPSEEPADLSSLEESANLPSLEEPMEMESQDEDISLPEEEEKLTDEENVKILQPPPSALDSSHAKNQKELMGDMLKLNEQIKEDLKQWARKKITKEISNQLTEFIDQKSQEIIQKTVEKAVWQVVPELAKQLITKELNKLLKEEEDNVQSPTAGELSLDDEDN